MVFGHRPEAECGFGPRETLGDTVACDQYETQSHLVYGVLRIWRYDRRLMLHPADPNLRNVAIIAHASIPMETLRA